jgi:hypothetical protein
VGDLTFKAFEVQHNPFFPTFGFVVKYKNAKAVIVADFNDWEDVSGYFIDSDFVFVESNHDLELLWQNYNPNSQFHMPNPETGKLLCHMRSNSKKPPRAVVLGHLSLIRNEPQIALKEIEYRFREEGIELDFHLLAAPGLIASEVLRINTAKGIATKG